jgi:hypothetical protein
VFTRSLAETYRETSRSYISDQALPQSLLPILSVGLSIVEVADADFKHQRSGSIDLLARIAPKLETALTAKDLGAVWIPAQLGNRCCLVGAVGASGGMSWDQSRDHF